MSFSHNCKLKIPCKRFFCLNFSDVAGFLAGLVKRAIAFLISHTCTFFFAAVFDRIFQTKEAKLQSVIIPFLAQLVPTQLKSKVFNLLSSVYNS